MKKKDWLIVLAPLFSVWLVDRLTKMWAFKITSQFFLGPLGFGFYQNGGAMLGLFSDLPPVLRIVTLSTGGSFLIFSFVAYLGRRVFGDRPLVVYKSPANLVGYRSTRKFRAVCLVWFGGLRNWKFSAFTKDIFIAPRGSPQAETFWSIPRRAWWSDRGNLKRKLLLFYFSDFSVCFPFRRFGYATA